MADIKASKKVNVVTSITLTDMSEKEVGYLKALVQNPLNRSPEDEDPSITRFRRAIFEGLQDLQK